MLGNPRQSWILESVSKTFPVSAGLQKQKFPIFRNRLPYTEWDMFTDRYIQSFKQEKYRLMKNFALLDTFDINI